jgi:flagellar biogenesis protein FliO
MSAEIGDPAREVPPLIGVLLFILAAWWQVRRIARERPPKDPPE